ncbi:MAG: helix-turn-helix transcriptional regulator [Solirubrobacteraceae bacterium]
MPLAAGDLVRLAYAHYWTGSLDSYLQVMERAFRAFVEGGDDAQAALAALMLQWDYLSKPAKSLANGWYRRATRILNGCPECVAHGYLAQARTWQMLDEGNFDAALRYAHEIAEIGSRLGDRDLEVLGLQRQAHVLVSRGDLHAGLAMLDEAVVAAVSGELGTMITAVIYCAAITLCRGLGDYERAAEWSSAVMRWCEREACTGFPGLCRVYNAEIAGRRGGWQLAQTELIRACDELEQFGALAMAAVGYYELGEIYRRMGALDQAQEAYAHACEFGVDPEPGLSLLRLAQGDPAAAAAVINRAVTATGIGGEPAADLLACARLLPAQIEISIAASDLATAEAATEQLEAISSAAESKLLQAEVRCARAALALAQGKLEEALAEATRGRKLWQEISMPYESARARVVAAAVHRLLGDREAEEFELRLVRTAFDRLGVSPELIAAVAGLPTAGPLNPQVSDLRLTDRELEILRLIADGMTDAEIARRLYLSPHTVHRHVANIRTKTNQPSRAAVVAHATRIGIL